MASDGHEPTVVFEGSIVETSMIRDMLEEFGITAVMKDHRMTPYSGRSNANDGLPIHDALIMVPEKYTVVAKELIKQFQDPQNFME